MSKAQSRWGERISLPEIKMERPPSLLEAVNDRRSIRSYKPGPVALEDLAMVLHAAQGVTHPRGYRAAPSAGALYPLELHLAAGPDESIPAGCYRFIPGVRELDPRVEGDLRSDIAGACLNQSWMAEAPCCLVVCAVYERVTRKYGDRGRQYAHIEAGCAAQGFSLMAAALGLGTVCVGAFRDHELQQVLNVDEFERPLLAMPLGRA
ncbi:MAG: SagB/ThcOx family dehydrogenase [Desulfovibrionaceae bacterium]